MKCDGDGFVVFVHREVLAESACPGPVRFAFGSRGWCRLTLREGDGAR